MPSSTSVATDPDKRATLRRARFDARYTLWRLSQDKRAAFCGRFASGDTVQVRGGEGARAGFGGVQTCGRVWGCPVCSEKINAERHSELLAGMEAWIADGNSVEFATFTLQHNRRQGLRELWDAMTPAFHRVTSGAGVKWSGSKPRKDGTPGKHIGDRNEFRIAGYVRLAEVKHGGNGWHPHLHVLFFVAGGLEDWERAALRERMFARWKKALNAAGLDALDQDRDGRHVGLDLRPVTSGEDVADYFTKNLYGGTSVKGAAFEVTGSHAKEAGKGGRTPFEILDDLVNGEVVDMTTGELRPPAKQLALWYEWERVSKGRRQLTWSRGLRDLLRLGVEKTDEEIVEEEAGGEVLVQLDKSQYRELARFRLLIDVLELAEKDPTGDLLVRWLGRRGIHGVRTSQKPRQPSLFAA